VTRRSLADRVERCEIPAADPPVIVALIRQYVALSDVLREKIASIRRLQRIAFGPHSERRHHAGADTAPHDASTNADVRTDAPRARRRGHGRTKASAYTSARPVHVAHPALAAGGGCPSCCGGRLYRLTEPSPKICITGGPFLQATRYDRERLRCSSCLEVFTAPLPDGVDDGKFVPSADAATAVMR
jgi:hypothetical protein